jgi:hypothetical protein
LEVESQPPLIRLIQILETAPSVPLQRRRVRVDRVEVLTLIARITSPVNGQKTTTAPMPLASPDGAAALDAVRHAVWSAHPIPLTDQVRLPAAEAAALADRLRHLNGS